MINNNSSDIKKAQYLRISLNEQIKENNYKKGTIGDAINQALLKVLKHDDIFLNMFASMEEFQTQEISKHLKKAFEYAETKSKEEEEPKKCPCGTATYLKSGLCDDCQTDKETILN